MLSFPGLGHQYKMIEMILRQHYCIIDPLNKSNIYSFLLLTTYSAFEVLLKTYSFNDVNSGKLCILDLLKGSILTAYLLFFSPKIKRRASSKFSGTMNYHSEFRDKLPCTVNYCLKICTDWNKRYHENAGNFP